MMEFQAVGRQLFGEKYRGVRNSVYTAAILFISLRLSGFRGRSVRGCCFSLLLFFPQESCGRICRRNAARNILKDFFLFLLRMDG